MATRPYSETLGDALKDPADAAAYLQAALAEEDEEGFLLALRTMAEIHGIADVAKRAGVGRESLYKTLSEGGNPKLRISCRSCTAWGFGYRSSWKKIVARR